MILVGGILLAVFVLSGPWRIVVVVAAAMIEVGETLFWLWLSQRGRVRMGAETFAGTVAEVVSECRPRGQVRMEGELWQAHCAAGAGVGERVRVVALDGLTLIVEPARK